MSQLQISDLFSLEQTTHQELFNDAEYPWSALFDIKKYIDNYIKQSTKDEDRGISVGKNCTISDKATIEGPAIIGDNVTIRPGAYIRGNVIIGNDCVIGNSTELKHSMLFNGVQVPHFNYVGDSILGYKVHFGGGAVTSNLKTDSSTVTVIINGEKIDTGLQKLGALVGDGVELGANVILNPGTLIGKQVSVYPGAVVRGTVPENHIVKLRQTQEIVEKR